MMKKVLILAYDFPPLISIGAQRPYSWYQYLPDEGYAVTVVTRKWKEHINTLKEFAEPTEQGVSEETAGPRKIIRAPYTPNLRDQLLLKWGDSRFVLLRKALSLFYAFAEHLFSVFDAKATIFDAADKALQSEHYDVLIATGEPFLLFKYAHLLSKKYSVPWIADYRDGWTTNQGNYSRNLISRLLYGFYQLREKKYTATARLITTASPDYAAALKTIHPHPQIEVVYNGYNEEALNRIKDIKSSSSTFIITYAGTIYPHQKLELFLNGLARFVSALSSSQRATVECRFYGLDAQPEAKQRIMHYTECQDVIRILPRVPYDTLLGKLKESHILLLLSAKGARWLNAKLFDYLAVDRTIMLVENDSGIMEHIIKENAAGMAVETEVEVAELLMNNYQAFVRHHEPPRAVNRTASRYTRRNQTKTLTSIIHQHIFHE